MSYRRKNCSMATRKPETLTELLKTLERSGDLRSLARECGLSVRELRRRLSIWRRELSDEDEGSGSGTTKKNPSRKKGKSGDWPVLPSADDLDRSPVPARGRPVLEIFTDGASRGNPGPAAVGAVFRLKDGKEVAEYNEAIGRATNHVAEYRAIVAALEHCRRWKIKRVHLFLDSELIVRQLHGTYRVKSPDLRPLYQQVVFLSKGLDEFLSLIHI